MGEIVSIREAFAFPDTLPGFDPLHSVPCPARFQGHPLIIIGFSSPDNDRVVLHPDRESSVHTHTITTFVHPKHGALPTTFEPREPVIRLKDKQGLNPPEKSADVLDVSYLEDQSHGRRRVLHPELYRAVPGQVAIEKCRFYDGAQIYVLNEESYNDAYEEYLRLVRFPPLYQIAGITSPNCEVYSHMILRAAGIASPLYPWPNVTANILEKKHMRSIAKGFLNPLEQYVHPYVIAAMAQRAKERHAPGTDALEIRAGSVKTNTYPKPTRSPFVIPKRVPLQVFEAA